MITTIGSNGAHSSTPTTRPSAIPSGFSVSVEMIDSDTARAWLETYKGPNRNTSDTKVLQFQSDMENGRWHFEGAPIRLGDYPERLLDGKHRLTALANTIPGMQFPFVVERGLTGHSQLYMDQGQTRSTSQQLSLRGIGRASVYAAAAKVYLDWSNGRLFSSVTRSSTSKPAVVEWVLEHQPLLGELAETRFTCVEAPASAVGAFGIAVMQECPGHARLFFDKLVSGAGLEEGNPILALDRRLRNIRRIGTRVTQREYLAYFIKAWNAWLAGDRLSLVKLPNPLTESNFPELLVR